MGPTSDGDFAQRMQRVEGLLEAIEHFPDPGHRDTARELVQLLLDLHGAGLTRLLDLLRESSHDPLAAFAGDELVSSLLLLHGLHPQDLSSRLRQAIDALEPMLRTHEAKLSLLSLDEGTARLRLGASGTTSSLRQAVEEALWAAVPDLSALEIEPTTNGHATPGRISLPMIGAPPPPPPPPVRMPMPTVKADCDEVERCELCSKALGGEHAHLLELSSRKILCSCDPCAILFSGQEAARYQRIPRDPRRVEEFHLSEEQWESLRIPINLVFFFQHGQAGKIVALFPSPAGATETLLPLDTWPGLVQSNPLLATMEADVEALLLNRVDQRQDCYLAPIDECFRLVGLIRKHWSGLSGGDTVWGHVEDFFARLRARSLSVRGGGTCPT